jgi:hypothetical protein
MSDTFPLFGYKRKSYMVACGLLGTFSWATLALSVTSSSGAAVMMILASLSTACSDVVVDSIVVERARGEPQVRRAGGRAGGRAVARCLRPGGRAGACTAPAAYGACAKQHTTNTSHHTPDPRSRPPARCSRCAGALPP